jgi:hypothetical protein
MPERYRDDCPTAFSLSRRNVLIGGALLGGLNVLSILPAFPAQPIVSDDLAARFMDLSALLIQHRLDPVTGKRIASAMAAQNLSLPDHVTTLLDIARKKNARIVEDFFPDIPDGALKETALSIISAWYMGVVTNAPDAEVFAFEHALMYQPTRDVMTIPSYAKSGPNDWDAHAPALSDMPIF